MNRSKPLLKYLVMPMVGAGLMTALMGAAAYDQPTTPTTPAASATATSSPQGAPLGCPQGVGWAEGLVQYLAPNAQVPTTKPESDCSFHQWSWETFVWATAMINGQPRFMSLYTLDDLLATTPKLKTGKHLLRLAERSPHPGVDDVKPQVAGAIVEADGNMLVAPNGYPVLGSVHFNKPYLDAAKANMMYNGNYEKNDDKDYFPVGSAVFKATWIRYDKDSEVPQGAYTTEAEVPVLTIDPITNNAETTGKYVKAKVALLGLHVVGETEGHPEFLWATFEHRYNTPRLPDGTFKADSTFYNGNFTLYQSGTPFSQVNLQNQAGESVQLTFDPKTQKFYPPTNAVLTNQTGEETNSPQGPQNIVAVNEASQNFLEGPKATAEAMFANYDLIGTVWMHEGVYTRSNPNWQKVGHADAVGSVNLANTTAETFQQTGALPADPKNYNNCFSCHNPRPFSSTKPPQPHVMPDRLISISHAITMKTSYSVPNKIQVSGLVCGDVNAGPLFNQKDAQTTCPKVCAKTGQLWNGQWKTTVQGKQSVCGCCN